MGGALGWDGAMQLQWLQFCQMVWMAGVMPGQKTDDSAWASMELTPLWAECNADRIVSRMQGGMTILSWCDDAVYGGEMGSELEVLL